MTFLRVTMLFVCVTMLWGCEFFRDDVTRAQRNCEQAWQASDDTEHAEDAKHCRLVRSTCEIDLEGAACQALLERYR